MKELDTHIFKLKHASGVGDTDVPSGGSSRTKAWRVLCDAVTLVVAFFSMSVLTVFTIVFVVTTMAQAPVTPASDTHLGELAAHARQSGSSFGHWAYPDMLSMGPAFPADAQDDYAMFGYDQGFEPTWSW